MKKQLSVLQKKLLSVPGLYMRTKLELLQLAGITPQIGQQNVYGGSESIKIFVEAPYIDLFKAQAFDIPGTDEQLILGSQELWQSQKHLFEKAAQLIAPLWQTRDLCKYQAFHVILRIQSFMNLFTKSFPYKVHSSKLHTLGHHIPQIILERKNVGRESEQFIEHAVQIVKHAAFRARSQSVEERLKVLMKMTNSKTRSDPNLILGKRKLCDTCEFIKNNHTYPRCTCLPTTKRKKV